MHDDARNYSPAPADLPLPGEPGQAPAEGGMPVVVMTVHSRATHSKSFGSLIRSYGRGEGLVDSPRHPGLGGIPLVFQAITPSRFTAGSRSHDGVHRGYIGGTSARRCAPMRTDGLRVGGGRRGA
ncbi:hypothetical protein [Corynebacterium flavescens]|uniref:hypothetical protein n=1 Tax=Corynebacterium flavescens TaxID=28028 RepID=UPI003FCFB0BC